MSELSDAVPTDIRYEAFYQGTGQEDKWIYDEWICRINGERFPFRSGIGNRKLRLGWKAHGYGKASRPGFQVTDYDTMAFRPSEPPIADVLYCLLSDSDALEYSFEEWCGNFGYDTDSRKALSTYLKCQESGNRLRKAIGAETFARLRGLEH